MPCCILRVRYGHRVAQKTLSGKTNCIRRNMPMRCAFLLRSSYQTILCHTFWHNLHRSCLICLQREPCQDNQFARSLPWTLVATCLCNTFRCQSSLRSCKAPSGVGAVCPVLLGLSVPQRTQHSYKDQRSRWTSPPEQGARSKAPSSSPCSWPRMRCCVKHLAH